VMTTPSANPNCFISASHGAAPFRITCSVPGEYGRLEQHACSLQCMEAITDALKDMGGFHIIIAEPHNEVRILAALKAAAGGKPLPR
jgi:hypothetical protein